MLPCLRIPLSILGSVWTSANIRMPSLVSDDRSFALASAKTRHNPHTLPGPGDRESAEEYAPGLQYSGSSAVLHIASRIREPESRSLSPVCSLFHRAASAPRPERTDADRVPRDRPNQNAAAEAARFHFLRSSSGFSRSLLRRSRLAAAGTFLRPTPGIALCTSSLPKER